MDEQQPYARPGARAPRKHMGVATSDPEYLPPVNGAAASARSARMEREHPDRSRADRTPYSTLHGGRPSDRPGRADRQADPGGQSNYGRYISTPKKGRSIFTSRQDRQRRRVKIMLAVLIVTAVALALFWFFALR